MKLRAFRLGRRKDVELRFRFRDGGLGNPHGFSSRGLLHRRRARHSGRLKLRDGGGRLGLCECFGLRGFDGWGGARCLLGGICGGHGGGASERVLVLPLCRDDLDSGGLVIPCFRGHGLRGVGDRAFSAEETGTACGSECACRLDGSGGGWCARGIGGRRRRRVHGTRGVWSAGCYGICHCVLFSCYGALTERPGAAGF
jgi:hypothetical protein